MQTTRIALIQLPWLGTAEAMEAEYRLLTKEARRRGASLICLPEFSLTPYFPGTTNESGFDWAEKLPDGPCQAFFCDLARDNNVHVVGSLFEKTDDRQFFDTATIASPDGTILGITRKIHIPYGEGYNETHFFKGGSSYPTHSLDTIRIATPTCYDQWFPELSRIYTLNGAELIFYPTAIGSEPTDPDIDTKDSWQTVMRGQAIANCVFIAAANRVGEENGVRFYGSSFICDPTGKILAQAGRDTTEVITADLDENIFLHWRKLFPLLQQRRPDSYAQILEAAVEHSTQQPENQLKRQKVGWQSETR
jgi:N-carbamoylputrescine amidase